MEEIENINIRKGIQLARFGQISQKGPGIKFTKNKTAIVTQFKLPEPTVKPLEWSEGYAHESESGESVCRIYPEDSGFKMYWEDGWSHFMHVPLSVTTEKELMESINTQWAEFFLSRLNR